MQSSIVPQIGSSVTLNDRTNSIMIVKDVIYRLHPSSNEIVCEVLVCFDIPMYDF
jgi:hypothetical protein